MVLNKINRSIRTRLVANSAAIVTAAFIVTLLVNIFIVDEMAGEFKTISSSNSSTVAAEMNTMFSNTKQKIQKLIEDQVNIKSKSLLSEAELVFSQALADSSFSYISQLLRDRVELDEDIVYASFFTKEGPRVVLWTLSSRFRESGMLFGAKYDTKSKSWVLPTGVRIADEKIADVMSRNEPTIEKYTYHYEEEGTKKQIEAYDVYTPVYAAGSEETQLVGYLRYIISLDKMRALLAQEDEKQSQLMKQNQDKLQALLAVVADLSRKSFQSSIIYVSFSALAMIFISCLLFYYMADKITVPILELKKVAVSIAGGDYNSKVAVNSQDEVGVLAGTFEQMRLQVKMFTEHLQSLVDQRTAELREALSQVTEEKQKIQEILTHIDQGIIMFDDSLQVLDQYSDHVKSIYECEAPEFVGRDVFDFLFGRSKADKETIIRTTEAVQMSINDDYLSWLGNKSHLIEEMAVEVGGGSKVLTINWHPIVNEDNVIKKVIVSFFDITQKRVLEEQIAKEKQRNRQMVDAISRILPHDPAQINRFLQQTETMLKEMTSRLQGVNAIDWDYISRELHTIKGNSRLFELNEFTSLVHDTETLIKDSPQIQAVVAKMSLCLEIIALHIDVFENVLKLGQGGVQSQSLFSIVNTRIKEINKRLQQENIAIESLICEDGVLDWNPSLLGKISDMLTHAIANAIDHGYVHPMNRGEAKRNFRLQVAALPEKGNIALSVTDWGAGINFDKIRQLAISRGLPHGTEEDLSNMLFRQAVSTAETVSMTSGRGDGMAAIKDIADGMGASIRMMNAEGAGARMRIVIPLANESDQQKKAS